MTPYQQDIDKVASQLQLPQDGNILITGATGLIGGTLVDILMLHSHCTVYARGVTASGQHSDSKPIGRTLASTSLSTMSATR